MKIRAVRVQNVRRFVAPVAVEGLSGGVDLLAEDNEFGKSTLFSAIETVFQKKHTMTGQDLERLRPYGGGDPLIEADFEAAGRRLRIRKRFGRGKGAELIDLDNGRTLGRGAPAEDELQQAIGAADGRLGLLWVGQRGSLTLPKPDDAAGNALRSAIEREVETVAAGGEARLVRARVKALLEPLVGGRSVAGGGRLPKTGSSFERALKEREGLARQLAEARERAASAVTRINRLEALLAERAGRFSDAAVMTLEGAAADGQKQLEAARAQRQQLEVAAHGRAEAVALADSHERALAEFDARLAALAACDAAAASAAEALAAAETDVAAAAERIGGAEAASKEFAAAEQAARTRIDAHTAAERRRDLASRLERSSRLLDAARKLEADLGAARRLLAANAVTAEAMHGIEELERAVTRLGDRLQSVAAAVAIALEPDARGRVRVSGRPLVADATLVADVPLVIEIAGIGTITVSPGASGDVAATQQALSDARAGLTARLAAAGAVDLADARRLRTERAAAERSLEVAGRALGQTAPEGAARLADAVRVLERQHAAAPEGAPLDDPEQATRELATLVQRRTAADAALAAARAANETIRERLATARERVAAEARRRTELTRVLPAPPARDGERARLKTAAEAASQRAAEAVRAEAALAGVAPSEARCADLARAAAAAALGRDEARRRAHELALAISDHEGQLKQAGEDGVMTRVAELEGLCERAEAEVQRFEAERQALLLLDETLAGAESEVRERFLRPVTERLAPYLAMVLPESELRLGDVLDARELVRGGVGEGLQALSVGTQEQLAILVRLAFGRLLAEAGRPAPLILDDALVFSDDARIARMFRALEAASEHHQVLVLTCRASLFDRLAARRVRLEPWTGASA